MHAFDILGDPVRRRILELLADGERTAGAVGAVVQDEFGISQPGVSAHLRVLRDAGFARVRPEGARRLYAVSPEPLREVDAWLPQVQQHMRPGDALFFTADHGVDPTYRGTDHTRECVPLIAYGEPIHPGVNLGVRQTYADLGQTLAEAFGTAPLAAGTSFADTLGLV